VIGRNANALLFAETDILFGMPSEIANSYQNYAFCELDKFIQTSIHPSATTQPEGSDKNGLLMITKDDVNL
jgi:hypothetical protein